jgi:hypothetical protein
MSNGGVLFFQVGYYFFILEEAANDSSFFLQITAKGNIGEWSNNCFQTTTEY